MPKPSSFSFRNLLFASHLVLLALSFAALSSCGEVIEPSEEISPIKEFNVVEEIEFTELQFHAAVEGDHYIYFPSFIPKNILVVAHGMYGENESAKEVAKRFIERWMSYADEHGLIVIAPVFDDERFGALSQGYGGYRGLFGKHVSADKFVNNLVNQYTQNTSEKSEKFYLYGHSAGGQFTNRYVVTHPQKIIKAVVSAAGRFSYPDKKVTWPYGAGNLTKTIYWDNGYTSQNVEITKTLSNYALAASKVTIVVGSADIESQPSRPGHVGTTRIEFAQSWARSMNNTANAYNMPATIEVRVIDGIGHNSRRLTPYCAAALFD